VISLKKLPTLRSTYQIRPISSQNGSKKSNQKFIAREPDGFIAQVRYHSKGIFMGYKNPPMIDGKFEIFFEIFNIQAFCDFG